MAKRKLWVSRADSGCRIHFKEPQPALSLGSSENEYYRWYSANEYMFLWNDAVMEIFGSIPLPGECDEYEVTIRKVQTWVRA